MSKLIKVIFIISLAFNFAVLGVMAGHKLGFWHKHHHGFKKYVIQSVPAEKRDAVEKILKEYKAGHKAYKRSKKEKWQKFEALLTVEPFNRDEFITAFNAENEGRTTRWVASGKVIADIAELLTVEERKDLLTKLKKRGKWKRRFLHKHDKNDEKKNEN